MQISTNEEFIKRRRQIGQIGSLLTFVLLGGGFVISVFAPEYVLLSYAVLIPGMVAFYVSRFHTVRWGMHTREDTALVSALKGLDKRYSLYQYSPSLPASHMLVGPSSVYVIEMQLSSGRITNTGSRWRKRQGFMDWLRSAGEGRLGNPTRVALKDIEALRALLQQKLGDKANAVNVDGIIAFASGNAFLNVEQPTVQVIKLSEIKAYLRNKESRKVIPANVVAQINAIAEGKA